MRILMSNQYRTSNSKGLINKEKIINFTFNGNSYQGYEGDTLASALIANGVLLIGRSFKYHRPRGFFRCRCRRTKRDGSIA